jgi:5,5'-dehydrodivanillate O-demethylase
MGPAPAPELPVHEPFTRNNCFREIAISDVPCNWFQCQENSIDPVHFEWMHDNWSIRQSGKDGPYATKHLKLAFDEFEHGFVYRRVREGQPDGSTLWTVGRVFLWPLGFYLGGHYEWRVPVDDENTLSVTWFSYRVPKEQEPYVQKRVPTWFAPIKKADGRWIDTHVINQDTVAWVGQGVIADRTKEMLGASDKGISMIRNRFFEELEAVKKGADPKGTIRDPEQAKFVDLPNANADLYRDGLPREAYSKNPLLASRLKRFPFLAGQPKEVREEFCRAVGIDETGAFLADNAVREPAE